LERFGSTSGFLEIHGDVETASPWMGFQILDRR
jgi:hypothetical protein